MKLVVDELNRRVAPSNCRQLSLWCWETDARPGLHLEGPQGLIDERMEIAESDVVVGIFRKRFGTPTGDARSGTEHELRTAWEAWRQSGRADVMVYFSQQPASPATSVELEQWLRVVRFRGEPLCRPHPRTRRLGGGVGDRRPRSSPRRSPAWAAWTRAAWPSTTSQRMSTTTTSWRGSGLKTAASDLAGLAAALREPVDGFSPTDCRDVALARLDRGEERWLLLLDNLDSPAQLEPGDRRREGRCSVAVPAPRWRRSPRARAADGRDRRRDSRRRAPADEPRRPTPEPPG